MTQHPTQCAAAHRDDSTPCEGDPQAVVVRDQHGTEVTGCVHHAARMLASVAGARVYPGPGATGDREAVDAWQRAQKGGGPR